ncbi:NDI, mitochondrial NADH dehydrogenase, catalyzes the oxidation of cytosolic [Agaricus bisporus var. burnettii JB137-S8]|uniref:NDI, mitochondrial NADH dehydrogenase, catalyzes the oxidation of cytosolic n=1 Tax=Agaricus bisporus var. burnettii (strain JB137-S8 / ATCC MYA-4627 / FGSC 10392) TaxID=597362 RepID=K5Y3F8_AGABU|nr:NDI, mitochondrial NADH dehydrogenase, catalyzes the oxidation of cytosolic [Agaricus bisporus var. burnettii JB137-S8]EKM82475.1 NDI, mitochondrial NADH dehydrogenase, catalyzes the oxidation of cytosolic [Agaricus bisporus var. burnettii JB137-S8]
MFLARRPHTARLLFSPRRTASTQSQPLRSLRTTAKWASTAVLASVVGVLGVGTVIFVHDAFTYQDRHVNRVPVSPLALHPERGGPKNLPIVHVQVDDDQDEENKRLTEKPRLVIVGGGWGAMGVLRKLRPGDYHVTVISTDTFNTFTPLLPSAAVGTVQVRSLIEPIRKIIARLRGHFIQGKASDVVINDQLLEVQIVTDGRHEHIYVPYDKLVVAVGSTSSTHGVPGLENCYQLKTISDAQAIRRRVMDNFELASLPTTSPEERKRLLSFVICGGGPTGVETAAEIHDFCQEDIFNYFPKILREEVSIHLIQSREHILNTYSEEISKYAEKKFQRGNIDVITSARVIAVTPTSVLCSIRNPDTKVMEQHTIPTNFVLWSTGIAMNPFTQRLCDILPNQVHRKAVETDAYLRVKGAPKGTIYAIGDCATIETSAVDHFMELVEECDKNKDGKIDFEEFEDMVQKIQLKIPMAESHLSKVRELFQLYDSDADQSLSLNELMVLLQELGRKITALPATAQVAAQQGKYVGSLFTRLARHKTEFETTKIPQSQQDEATSKPFKYSHLGSLAYIGNSAVFDFGKFSLMGGLAAMYAWRSIYWNEQVSSRTRSMLMIDWIVRGIWGRDLSRL